MIAKSKKSSPVQRAAAVLIFAVLAGVGLTDAYPAPPPLEFGTATNLGPTINTSSHEAYAFISADGLSLWFSRMPNSLNERPEILVATRATKDDPWGTPVSLGLWGDPAFTYESIRVVPGLTSGDGLEVYFSDIRPGGYGSFDLWMMKRETVESGWGPPINLGPVVNSSYQEASPTISSDGLELYFSGYASTNNRPAGYGGADLWVTRRATRNGPWGWPVNLGPTVNSASADIFPIISANDLSLFFSSQRPGGYGQWDMYMINRGSLSEQWGQPVNLGPLINSPGSEDAVWMSADGSTLFFNSDRPGGYGGQDIWQAPILSAPTCGDADHPYPAVDLNKDCRVDLADLAVLLAHWLECTAPECE